MTIIFSGEQNHKIPMLCQKEIDPSNSFLPGPLCPSPLHTLRPPNPARTLSPAPTMGPVRVHPAAALPCPCSGLVRANPAKPGQAPLPHAHHGPAQNQ